MGVQITESGDLSNEVGPRDRPRENEYFSNSIDRVVEADTIITGWEISGDVPVGLSINSNGVISGVIARMKEQPSCVPKKPYIYPELDGRNYPHSNGGYVNNTYDFVFTTTVNWLYEPALPVGTSISGSTSVSHTITLIRDWNIDGNSLFADILDGTPSRQPYHCSFSGPKNKDQCEIIGGSWDPSLEICSIHIPKNQNDCEMVGGSWENGKCNMLTIKTQRECERIGGVWTKNTVVYNGVTYDNSTDYLAAMRSNNPPNF